MQIIFFKEIYFRYKVYICEGITRIVKNLTGQNQQLKFFEIIHYLHAHTLVVHRIVKSVAEFFY